MVSLTDISIKVTNMIIKNKDLILFIAVLIFILLFVVFISYGFHSYLNSEQDFCLDSDICAEGLNLDTEFGRIKINKETCLKYGWKWNKDKKSCKLK